jgi:putative NADH-flavin reductase
MKLVVLGSIGGTGIETVRQAIAQRHPVTAFVRSPERRKPFAGQIIMKQGERELKRLRKLDS